MAIPSFSRGFLEFRLGSSGVYSKHAYPPSLLPALLWLVVSVGFETVSCYIVLGGLAVIRLLSYSSLNLPGWVTVTTTPCSPEAPAAKLTEEETYRAALADLSSKPACREVAWPQNTGLFFRKPAEGDLAHYAVL